jgi:hypothetical protein
MLVDNPKLRNHIMTQEPKMSVIPTDKLIKITEDLAKNIKDINGEAPATVGQIKEYLKQHPEASKILPKILNQLSESMGINDQTPLNDKFFDNFTKVVKEEALKNSIKADDGKLYIDTKKIGELSIDITSKTTILLSDEFKAIKEKLDANAQDKGNGQQDQNKGQAKEGRGR